ncbi:phosphoenolpyruvate carboxykinase (ATP) [Mechercharimyces sp. CAU 1602]|uniref:phosphoenolpyruvate carboxykinase (ATP) n=1 Tax=Mechercharimyces sp. CAU 1602 TaxID=2973933 RepID=UPI0021637FA4|nr:phosphoenolpyruvate carboxykinase (ATP) [Mechercharimyces sp. CAU 1602]MCS1351961.1 phosphoenolpyruvate carboxykinase (ATP) [Mechercharimyces sp. CAU 1602]
MSTQFGTNRPTEINFMGPVHRNLPVSLLVEKSLAREESVLTDQGALHVTTGKYTGRSPKDKYIVDEPSIHDKVDWGSVNQPMSPDTFERLYQKVKNHLEKREVFIFQGYAGSEEQHRLPLQVINEKAWQNLFVHQLFVRPTAEELLEHVPQFTVISVPECKADPEVDGTHSETFIAVSFERRMVLIGGTHYAGEIKKSVFSVMNFLLPEQNVLPMHCSANRGDDGDVALFFGLSGTGKTTLSADPERLLIGDDEHGWSDRGIFNVEGGCYAKCIGLSAEKEPQIWNAIRFGSVLENVVLHKDHTPDFEDTSLTENTRVAYPIHFIPGAQIPGIGENPQVIIFLTADAFGVLPPIAKLSPAQAMYHFLSGYTSKLAGTERGVTEPEATFSACFGAPFLPRPAAVYADMLGEKIAQHNVRCYLVNTGWTGGPYGEGERMKLCYTREMVRAAIDGSLEEQATAIDPVFGLTIPTSCPQVPQHVLNPRNTWADKDAYDQKANELASLFQQNAEKFIGLSEGIRAAGPKLNNTRHR